jgi:hypothetical protein
MLSRNRFGFGKMFVGALCAAAALHPHAAHAATATSPDGGFSVEWTQIGSPLAARKIAAGCGTNAIYALNYDKSLWVNNANGADNSWSYVGTWTGADSMGCDGSDLSILNTDKTLWHATGLPNWGYTGTPTYAAQLGGGNGFLFALNTDSTIWSDNDSADNAGIYAGQNWTYRGTDIWLKRVTGAAHAYIDMNILDNPTVRTWGMNQDGSLWYNDGLTITQYHPFPTALPSGVQAIEFAAYDSDGLYVLDSTYHLWRAVQHEGNCYDGVDNDKDGVTDFADDDCRFFSYVLNVPPIYQDESNWCWIASAKMVLGYVAGDSTSECTLANQRQANSNGWNYNNNTSIDCCSNGRPSWNDPVPPNGCNHTGGAGSIYADKNISNSWSNTPLSWTALQNEFRANRPVSFDLTWNNCTASNCGHQMVAIGEHMDAAGGDWVVANDPGNGDTIALPYNVWSNQDPTQYGFVFNGQFSNIHR